MRSHRSRESAGKQDPSAPAPPYDSWIQYTLPTSSRRPPSPPILDCRPLPVAPGPVLIDAPVAGRAAGPAERGATGLARQSVQPGQRAEAALRGVGVGN
jgi:hypothetical protein